MIEWFKLCEAVRVFRDSMIGVLCLSGRFRSVADDLLGIGLHSIEKYETLIQYCFVVCCVLSASEMHNHVDYCYSSMCGLS